MSNLDYAAKQLNKIRNRIRHAAHKAGRKEADIELIGASKMQSHALIRDFTAAGLASVGENYLQEAIDKQQNLQELALSWHFIGHIQSNKTKLIAQHFDWVHGVDRFKIARRLSDQNSKPQPLNALLQINLDDEQSKSGAKPLDAVQICDQISQLKQISLRGLMLIPKPRSEPNEQMAAFAQARELLSQINQKLGLNMDQLSMGMSSDLEAAISEGSTMVRIGTDLFGPRPS